MQITNIVAQLRTTDLAASIGFYTTRLGFTLEFQYEDFYAGVRADRHVIHLKLVDDVDPSIAFVDRGEHFHLYLETDDVVAAAERLRSPASTSNEKYTRRRGERASSSSRTTRATPCTSASDASW